MVLGAEPGKILSRSLVASSSLRNDPMRYFSGAVRAVSAIIPAVTVTAFCR
jgi:hypothetical protein